MVITKSSRIHIPPYRANNRTYNLQNPLQQTRAVQDSLSAVLRKYEEDKLAKTKACEALAEKISDMHKKTVAKNLSLLNEAEDFIKKVKGEKVECKIEGLPSNLPSHVSTDAQNKNFTLKVNSIASSQEWLSKSFDSELNVIKPGAIKITSSTGNSMLKIDHLTSESDVLVSSSDPALLNPGSISITLGNDGKEQFIDVYEGDTIASFIDRINKKGIISSKEACETGLDNADTLKVSFSQVDGKNRIVFNKMKDRLLIRDVDLDKKVFGEFDVNRNDISQPVSNHVLEEERAGEEIVISNSMKAQDFVRMLEEQDLGISASIEGPVSDRARKALKISGKRAGFSFDILDSSTNQSVFSTTSSIFGSLFTDTEEYNHLKKEAVAETEIEVNGNKVNLGSETEFACDSYGSRIDLKNASTAEKIEVSIVRDDPQVKHAEKIKELIQKAADVFNEYDYTAKSLDEISRECGYYSSQFNVLYRGKIHELTRTRRETMGQSAFLSLFTPSSFSRVWVDGIVHIDKDGKEIKPRIHAQNYLASDKACQILIEEGRLLSYFEEVIREAWLGFKAVPCPEVIA